MEADGHFVVSWASENEVATDSRNDVFAHRFDPAGNPVAAPFRVNTYTSNHQVLPAVASLGAETFVVTWDSFLGPVPPQDGDGGGIYAQRFGDLISRDGFETGDLSRWSSAVTDGGDLSVAPGRRSTAPAWGLRLRGRHQPALRAGRHAARRAPLPRALPSRPQRFRSRRVALHRRTRTSSGSRNSNAAREDSEHRARI